MVELVFEYYQILSDFTFNKKEESRGIYGKRTTLYDNYKFDIPKSEKFYSKRVYDFDVDVYNRDDEFWEKSRLEQLNKDERGVYKMLDTLKTVKKFLQASFKWGDKVGRQCDKLTKLNFFKLMWC